MSCAVTTVYLHGNRYDPVDAKRNGLQVYHRLVAGSQCHRPLRHVIWSWPSEPIPRRLAILRDVHVKYRRTTPQSYYLACWLARMGNMGPCTLLGYSYGARTILGALQLRAGGQFQGYCLPPECHCRCRQYRVVLWAAATQRDWLLPGCPHGCAFNCVQQGVLMYNPCDRVLKQFDRFILCVQGPALGLTGLPYWPCAAIRQINATGFVGKSHSLYNYICCECMMAIIRNYVN